MKKFVLFCFLFLFLGGCTQTKTTSMPDIPDIFEEDRLNRYARNFDVLKIEDGRAGAEIYSITSSADVVNEQLEEDKLNFVPDEEIEEKRKKLEESANAMVVVLVSSISIKEVSNPNFNVIIKSNKGEVVSQRTGPNSVARSKRLYSMSIWENLIACTVPKEIEKDFEVYIVNTLENKRNGFSVKAK